MLVLGLRAAGQCHRFRRLIPPQPRQPQPRPASCGRRGRAVTPISSSEDKPWQEEWGPVLVGASMIAIISGDPGAFDFIANNTKIGPRQDRSWSTSFTKTAGQAGWPETLNAILGMVPHHLGWPAAPLALLERAAGARRPAAIRWPPWAPG